MKEATGELNMTVVTVLAIGAIATIFYTLVWHLIKSNITNKTNCANAVCGTCGATEPGVASCTYIDDSGDSKNISCACNK